MARTTSEECGIGRWPAALRADTKVGARATAELAKSAAAIGSRAMSAAAAKQGKRLRVRTMATTERIAYRLGNSTKAQQRRSTTASNLARKKTRTAAKSESWKVDPAPTSTITTASGGTQNNVRSRADAAPKATDLGSTHTASCDARTRGRRVSKKGRAEPNVGGRGPSKCDEFGTRRSSKRSCGSFDRLASSRARANFTTS